MVNFNDYIISANKLQSNLKKIRRYIGRQTKICAVVKSDAYGLGVKNICPIITDEVDYYAVVCVKEAMELRLIDPVKPILILSVCNLDYINWCANNNVEISISTLEEVRYINKYLDGMIKVHIKINSGMNRYGVKSITILRQILKEIRKSQKIIVVGAYTHFATKAENLDFIDVQYEKFIKMIKEIKVKDLLVHCANSYVATTDKLKLCNMVRVGFSMYSDHYDRLKINNVLSINARLIAINNVSKGESVGYDRTFVAKRKSKIGIVSVGYNDGFARNLSNNFKVLINGQFVNVVGNVCMDCFMVDLTDISGCFIGSEVVILGVSGDKEITLEDYAKALNFSPYEVLTGFKTRRMNVIVKNE